MQEMMLANKSFKLQLLTTMPVALSNFGATTGDGYLHIHGGTLGGSQGNYGKTYYYMNLATKAWSTGAAGSTVYCYNDLFFVNRADIGKRLYSEGGFSPSITTTGYYFTAESAAALISYTTGDTAFGTRAEKRWVNIDNDHVYMVGGYNGTLALAGVNLYSFTTGTFTAKAALPKPLDGHEVGYWNGYLYCWGGYSSADGLDQSAVYRYDPTANTWTKITDMPWTSSWHGGCMYKGWIVMTKANSNLAGPFQIWVYNVDTGLSKLIPNAGIQSRIGMQVKPDPTVLGGILLMGGTNGGYVGQSNYDSFPRFNQIYFMSEAQISV